MKKTLSLDLGSASIGWAVTSWQSHEESRTEQHGIITFKAGMHKDGNNYVSPTKTRREHRNKRILLQHRRSRNQALLALLVRHKMVPLEVKDLNRWRRYRNKPNRFPKSEAFIKWLELDPYDLRVKGLDQKLTPHEFGRALHHLGQRRGYQDIGEIDVETEEQSEETENQKEKGKQKPKEPSTFQKAMAEHTILSKALKKEFLDKQLKTRNQEDTILREHYEAELLALCEAQGLDTRDYKHYDSKAKSKNSLVQSLYHHIIYQRPLKSQKQAVGKCTLETLEAKRRRDPDWWRNPARRRCPASHPLFELYRAWQVINNIKYETENGMQPLEPEDREFAFTDVFLTHGNDFKFEDLRKKLDKKLEGDRTYNYKDKQTIAGLPFCKGLYNLFNQHRQRTAIQDRLLKAFTQIDPRDNNTEAKIISCYSLSDLWHVVYDSQNLQDSSAYLKRFAKTKLGLTPKKQEAFAKLESELNPGYAKLSAYALRRILGFLQAGYLYQDAVTLARFPDLLKDDWTKRKTQVLDLLAQSRTEYEQQKVLNQALNSLIQKYENEADPEPQELENNAAKTAKKIYKDWQEHSKLNIDLSDFRKLVQDEAKQLFNQPKRFYQKTCLLEDIFLAKIRAADINVDEHEVYHHSKLDNPYGEAVVLPNGIYQLPIAQTLSIRNPMFNKVLAVLRKLINHLLKEGQINSYTQIILEIPRELNDKNERAGIEFYQNYREKKRAKYRKELEKKGYFEDRKVSDRYLEKYELWMEQDRRCLYTGKMIGLSQLFSPEIEFEHTIPQSLFPDNTMENRTVAFTYYNRDIKKKRLPTECHNYKEEIKPRLKDWEDKRDEYEKKYKQRLKPRPNETEKQKNNRIKYRYKYKKLYEYWNDKLERFTCTKVTDRWTARLLKDTQIISKYALKYLQTVFQRVSVQKGRTTAEFRRMYGFGKEGDPKNRDTHLHHVIDAVALSLIPASPQATIEMLKNLQDDKSHQQHPRYIKAFNAQKCIQYLKENTLVYHFNEDKILKQTKKVMIKNGKKQYELDAAGKKQYYRDKQGNLKPKYKYSRGVTVRGRLFQDTFYAKLAQGERILGKWQPKRNTKGEIIHFFAVRKAIDDDEVFGKLFPVEKRQTAKDIDTCIKKAKDIVDPPLRERIIKQLKAKKEDLTDFKGRRIRHVRIKTGGDTGRPFKARQDYRSRHEYKNYFYASAGEILYALLLQRQNPKGKIERKLIPIPVHEIAQSTVKNRFDQDRFIEKFGQRYFKQNFRFRTKSKPKIEDYTKKILNKYQKVIVLNNQNERQDKDRIPTVLRLYKLKQFHKDGRITLQHHVAAGSPKQIQLEQRSKILDRVERKYKLGSLTKKEKDGKFQKRRLERIPDQVREDIKVEFNKIKLFYTNLEEGEGKPYLGLTQANWNFLYEGVDFEMSITGEITWL